VFRAHANAQCVRCHEAGGEGYQAGPVLAGIATRATPEYLLESLIDPSRQIADGFATISLVTRDGEVIDGTKLRETSEELTLRLSSGEIRKVAQKEIQKQSTSSVSAMPPMGEVLTLFEIRDLLAYLGTLK
jgi:putative heme-binding domain-containing protein